MCSEWMCSCHSNVDVTWTRAENALPLLRKSSFFFYIFMSVYGLFFNALIFTFATSTIQKTKNLILLESFDITRIAYVPYKWSTCSKCQLKEICIFDSYYYYLAVFVCQATNLAHGALFSHRLFGNEIQCVAEMCSSFSFTRNSIVSQERIEDMDGSFDVRNYESIELE